MLTVRLFGTPQLLRDGNPLSLPRRKSRALVYYVAAHPQPVTREHLLAFFWPDSNRVSGQQSLRATLYSLRKVLGDALVGHDAAVALAPGSEIDCRALEAAVLRSTASDDVGLRAALELYRGEFLAEFALPDNEEFESWLLTERERFRRLAVRGWTALAEARESAADYAGALDALEHALNVDPLQEDVQRAALRLHYLAGDRAGAIRRYDAFRRLLNDEMGVPPMAATRALYDAIITDSPAAPARVPLRTAGAAHPAVQTSQPDAPLPFSGRVRELALLKAAAAAHKVALIEGDAGIGKTRLAEEFIRASGMRPLIGRARELEYAVPYQPIIDALRGVTGAPEWQSERGALKLLPVWWDELSHLLPELGHSDPHPPASVPAASAAANDESRLWEAVFQFLSALASDPLSRAPQRGELDAPRQLAPRAPLALLLDDAHWADASSLALLGYVARRASAAATPISLLFTTRPVAARSPLSALRQTLVRESLLEHIVLARLSPDDTLELARRLSAVYAYPLAEQLAQVSEGNPYILTELVREARERHVLFADGTVNLDALSAITTVPHSVYSLIQSRLERLSDAARRVLDVGVAVGREFDFDVVARAAGLSEGAVLDALDELRGSGLIVPRDGQGFAFDHTLTMEVAYREAGEPRHRAFHRRVAEALEEIHRANPDEVAGLLAWHFAEGQALKRAAPYAWRAAQAAAALPAWKEAIAFYEQALAGTSNPAQRVDILLALGDAQERSGAVAQAVDTFRQALPAAESQGRGDTVRLGLARSLMSQGRFAEAVSLTRQVAAGTNPENALDAEFVWGTALSIEGADLDGATEHLERAARISADRADRGSLARVKFELGGVAAQRGDLETAVALYHESLVAARGANDDTATMYRAFANNNLGYHLHLLGDPSAIDYAREGLRLAREKAILILEPFLLSTLGEIELDGGAVDAAEAHFREGLAIAEQNLMLERVAGLTANLGLVAIRRGQNELAINHLSSALARAETLGVQHLTAQIHLWLAPLLPGAEARAHLAAARAIAESGGRKLLLEQIEHLEHS